MTADTLPAQLTSACPQTRPGTADDAVAGVVPGYVAAPATEAEATALLAAAAGLGLAVLPRGGGTRLGWGAAPGRCDLVVDTRRLDAVLEHAAGDLVVRVQAGVPLAGLARVLAGAGQRLAVDPPDSGGTVGGLIAAGVAGPLRLRYGLPRDLLIGITMIRADGVLTRAGGKVVKNVAGYDTGKLLAGSFGTLGLITEATFRLHPVPPAVRYVSADYAGPQAAAAALLAVASSTLVPAAAELDWPRDNAPVSVAIRLEGDSDGVAERAGQLQTLLAGLPGGQDTGTAVSEAPPRWWSAADDDGTLLEVSFWASRLAGILGQIRAAATAAGLDPAVGGSGAAGVLHAALPADAGPGAVARFVTALRAGLPPGRASAVVRHAPPPVRDAVDLWGPVPSAGLMRAVKDQFDPGHRMAPGRFAGGI
jgi:glycolate oxidase FAD binding subunit